MATKKDDTSGLQPTSQGVDLTASKLPADKTTPEVQSDHLTPQEQVQVAADPTPAQEAQVNANAVNALNTEGVETRDDKNPGNPTPRQYGKPGLPIDSSNIGVETNQEFQAQLPTNNKGQVVISDAGVEGLSHEDQPLPSAVTSPKSEE